jgi:hypothetical protein
MAVAKHRCTNCKKYFEASSMIKVFAGNFCDQNCIVGYGMNSTARVIKKASKLKKKVHAKQKRDFYDKDRRHQLHLTQTVFNRLRKLQEYEWFADRGLEPECISCGKKNMDWCCSHLKTVGSQGALRFDKDNTKLACNRYCNKALSGNINGNKTSRGYLKGLHERFGDKEAIRIIEYCNEDRVKTWDCNQLISMRKAFNKEIREICSRMV